MNLGRSSVVRSATLVGVALVALAPALAVAQEAPQSATEAESAAEAKDIVVTGTLIRGIAPTGSNSIAVSKEDVQATGASTTSQLLAQIPQVANMFNALPQLTAGTGVAINVVRPNLRNTPQSDLATGASTLILVDGHRLPGVGVAQSAPDPEAVPPAAIERVEIITDGGSSTYGSDAIGGVINFVTRRRFDGLEVGGRYGFADNYHSWDVNGTIGKDWGTGSIYLSYAHAQHDDILGRDRDYVKSIDWNTGIEVGRQCASPNITVAGLTYVVSGATLVRGGPVTCDTSDLTAIYPVEKSDSVFSGLYQELNDALTVDLRAFYRHRSSHAASAPQGQNITVTAANPYYRSIGGGSSASQAITLNFQPAFGPDLLAIDNRYAEWGATANLAIDLPSGWQMRNMFNYGRTRTEYFGSDLNATAITNAAAGTSTATALNPYDLLATNPTVLANIRNWERAGHSKDELINFRSIVDGSLFALPGGEVRVAFGAEYLRDNFKQRLGSQVRNGINALPYRSYGRTVKSLFGELQVPLVSAQNNVPLINALDVSVSGRYDKYNDFGSTFNPKIGASYKPVDWISLRGNWGESFNAPTPVDQIGIAGSLVNPNNFLYQVPPGQTGPVSGAAYVVVVSGAAQNLKPQTATTWSVGGEIRPPFVPGLRLSATYYSMDFKGTLGRPPVTNSALLFANYPELVTFGATATAAERLTNPLRDAQGNGLATLPVTAAVIQAFAAQASNPSNVAFLTVPGAPPVYQLVDNRTRNFGRTKLSGLDFGASYTLPTGFGSIDARVNGNLQLTRRTQATVTSAFVDNLLTGASKLSLSAMLGATIGELRAQASWNHSAGYDVVRAANLPQDRVGAFNVVNLYFSYDIKAEGLLRDLSLTLNVNNVLDQDPPVFKLTGGATAGGSGYANGQTLGRFFQFGISKKF